MASFRQAGVVPVAISVDQPEVSRDFYGAKGFSFAFLSDPDAQVIRRYDLLHKEGGEHGIDIARPAELLVDRSGTVRWVNLTEDIRIRAKAEQLLAAARELPQ